VPIGEVFRHLNSRVTSNEVAKVGTVYQLDVVADGIKGPVPWTIDLKHGSGNVFRGVSAVAPSVRLVLTETALAAWINQPTASVALETLREEAVVASGTAALVERLVILQPVNNVLCALIVMFGVVLVPSREFTVVFWVALSCAFPCYGFARNQAETFLKLADRGSHARTSRRRLARTNHPLEECAHEPAVGGLLARTSRWKFARTHLLTPGCINSKAASLM
jgi:hypothetical protein